MSTFSQFAQNKDAINFKNAFDEVVQAKVDASLADTKQEVASRLFGDSDPVVGEETLDESLRKVSEHEHRGRKAVVYRNAEYNEYQVKFHHNGQHLKDADSFHNDKDDAQSTARNWVGHAHPGEGTNEETLDEAKHTYGKKLN